VTCSDVLAVDGRKTATRKAEHLRINLEEDVTGKGISTGFDEYRFEHVALPEIDLVDVDLGVSVLGWQLGGPLFISCMTGGVPEAEVINLRLAEVAQSLGLALGLGSARVLLEHPEAFAGFDVRRAAPTVPILANLGAVQLNCGIEPAHCAQLVERLDASAMVLHLNPLQEALQAEGDTCFATLLPRIARVVERLQVPVIVKEVGWGVAPDLVSALLDVGVAAVDIAGAGGTSWSEVERHRVAQPWRARVAAAFAGWGIPTAIAIREARCAAPDAVLMASGGIRGGMEMAKAIALGADMVGSAGPFLRAAAGGADVALAMACEWLEVLRITMFCVGARDVVSFRGTGRLRRNGSAPPWQ